MKFYNRSFILCVSLIAAACSTKRNPYFGDDTAQFKVSAPTPVSTRVSGENERGIPNKKKFILKSCFSDLASSPVPPGLVFNVKVGDGTEVSRKTDRDGCINWDREVGFSPLEKEKAYVLTVKFISKNELSGTVVQEIALNPISSEIVDMRDRSDAGQEDLEVVSGDTLNIEDITQINRPQNPIAHAGEQSILPNSNMIPDPENKTTTKVSVTEISLTPVRLNQDKSYSVDEYLNLYTHNILKFSASPKFYVKRFDSPDTALVPTKGLFKVTLVFMEEPDFEVNALWSELAKINNTQQINSVKTGLTSEQKFLQDNLQRMLTTQELKSNTDLTLNMKRRIMARMMLPYVQQSVQFTHEMTPEQGLTKDIEVSFTNLEKMNTRAKLAVTVEPIGNDIIVPMKSDGAGVIGSLNKPGGVKIDPEKVEADLIHAERELIRKSGLKTRPLVKYFQLSQEKFRDQAIKPLGVDNIPAKDRLLPFVGDYEFKKNLELYLAGEMNGVESMLFLKSLCHKVFRHANTQIPDENRKENLVTNCALHTSSSLAIQRLDFVENLITDKVDKSLVRGQATLEVSKAFAYAQSEEAGTNSNLGASAGFEGSLGVSKAYTESVGPLTGSLTGNLKASVGKNWFYTQTSSASDSYKSSASGQVGFKLNVEMNEFQIQANTRACLFVKPTDDLRERLVPFKVVFPYGFLACSDHVKAKNYMENFYIVTQDCPANAVIPDCASGAESSFRMTIRGRGIYAFFESVLKNTDVSILLKPVPQDVIRKELESWERQFESFRTTQVAPGAIVVE